MHINRFKCILKTEFGYQSTQKRPLICSILATLIYYFRLAFIILSDDIAIRAGKYDDEWWAKSSLFMFKSVEASGGTIHLSGLKGVFECKGPKVYIANHMSMLDALILPCLLLTFGKVTFVVKEQLLNYPFFGAIMKAVHPISIKRENPREDLKAVMSKGMEMISKGYSVVIFPQATRSAVFDPKAFNSLGVKLARKAGVPVVPIALKTDFQQNGNLSKEFGCIDPTKTVYIKFGDALSVSDSAQLTHQQIMTFIETHLKMWGGEIKQ